MNFTVNKITGDIYHLVFPSENLLSRTMLRFAEHFESPKFRGKVFSLRQFKRWYSFERGGEFTYYQDWGGFNVPGYVFKTFFNDEFDPLTCGEKDVLSQIPSLHQDYYVIASVEGDEDVLRHEIAHALFYLDEEYRKKATEIVERLPEKAAAKEEIRLMGYHPEVLTDELHAYVMEGYETIRETLGVVKHAGFKGLLAYWLASRKLVRLYNDTLVKHKANG